MPFKKKWGAISVKASEDRKLYDQAYYDIVKKPRRTNKDPIFLFQDVFSGMLITKKQLQKPINQSKIVLREGCNYLNPFKLDKYKQKAEEEMEDYFKTTTNRTLEFLKISILRGYITKDEILNSLGIEEKIKEVAYINSFIPSISRSDVRSETKAFVIPENKARVI